MWTLRKKIGDLTDNDQTRRTTATISRVSDIGKAPLLSGVPIVHVQRESTSANVAARANRTSAIDCAPPLEDEFQSLFNFSSTVCRILSNSLAFSSCMAFSFASNVLQTASQSLFGGTS